MSDQMSLWDTASVISSPASECGATHSGKQDGVTIVPSGQRPVHANLTARQAKEQGLMMSGTSGHRWNGSLASANLQKSMESRLRAKLLNYGSILYTLTWKPWVTPLGVSRSRLRASQRRTSETELTGWPTPSCSNDRTGNPQSALEIQRKDGTKVQQRLQDFAAIIGPMRLTASGQMLTGSAAGMESGGQLNPGLPRWLMGLPPEWQLCVDMAMQSMPFKRKSSSKAQCEKITHAPKHKADEIQPAQDDEDQGQRAR